MPPFMLLPDHPTFIDDGVSGVTMNRPGFNDMMLQLEENRAAALLVKDLSRLGRNYIEVGRLMEEFFPEHNIRLVAVSDNIDTDEGENEMAPIRNLFNEWNARDISKKRRISNRIEVHQAEKINGEWVQRLTIHCNCIGALFIPDTEPLPVPNVTVNTRRGVYVTYEPAQNE